MIELMRLCPGEKRERDNAHCFLRVVRAVTVRHPRGAQYLPLPEKLMDEMRRQLVKNDKKKKHHERAEKKSGDRRRDHRHNNFRPKSFVPFDHAPISFRGRNGRTAKTADQRMTRARW